jgi:2-methylcitrate dehydratase PrpD
VADGTVGYKDIECLTVHLSERTLNGFVGARFEAGDTRTVAALFSVHATAAIALIHGTVRPEHLTASALADPELAQMLGRIELAGTLPNSQRLTAEITARLRSGEVRHVRVEHPDGNILRTPLEHDQVVEKFSKNLEFSHPELAARKDALLDQFEHLASAPDLRNLIAALDPAENFTPNYQEQLS